MISQCPNCKSFFLIKQSRPKYLTRLFICLVLAILGVVEFYGISEEKDVDMIVLIGLFGGAALFLISFISAIYYLIKTIKTKETTYVCGRCQDKLKPDEIIQHIGNDQEILLETIKKKKSTE